VIALSRSPIAGDLKQDGARNSLALSILWLRPVEVMELLERCMTSLADPDSARRPSGTPTRWTRLSPSTRPWWRASRSPTDAGLDEPPLVIGHSAGGAVTLRLAALSGHRIGGAVVIDSAFRGMAAEKRGERERAAQERLFRTPRVYPSREAAIAQFRPIPSQPVLGYLADHVAATSVCEVAGGWTWKWDPGIFARAERGAVD
jgi:hypothetical protein